MKFSLVRPALALGIAAALASCGGGKATYPVHVTVYNVLYEGLILSTNGQDVAVPKATSADGSYSFTFPKQIEYGEIYNVLPKGQTSTSAGAQPAHQTCQPSSQPPKTPNTGTAGQFASIDITFLCTVNAYAVGGTITGLKGTGLTLINGSTSGGYAATPVLDASGAATDIKYTMPTTVPFGNTYGVTILTQPAGQTCTLVNGTGTLDQTAENAGGISNINVTCQ